MLGLPQDSTNRPVLYHPHLARSRDFNQVALSCFGKWTPPKNFLALFGHQFCKKYALPLPFESGNSSSYVDDVTAWSVEPIFNALLYVYALGVWVIGAAAKHILPFLPLFSLPLISTPW